MDQGWFWCDAPIQNVGSQTSKMTILWGTFCSSSRTWTEEYKVAERRLRSSNSQCCQPRFLKIRPYWICFNDAIYFLFLWVDFTGRLMIKVFRVRFMLETHWKLKRHLLLMENSDKRPSLQPSQRPSGHISAPGLGMFRIPKTFEYRIPVVECQFSWFWKVWNWELTSALRPYFYSFLPEFAHAEVCHPSYLWLYVPWF